MAINNQSQLAPEAVDAQPSSNEELRAAVQDLREELDSPGPVAPNVQPFRQKLEELLSARMDLANSLPGQAVKAALEKIQVTPPLAEAPSDPNLLNLVEAVESFIGPEATPAVTAPAEAAPASPAVEAVPSEEQVAAVAESLNNGEDAGVMASAATGFAALGASLSKLFGKIGEGISKLIDWFKVKLGFKVEEEEEKEGEEGKPAESGELPVNDSLNLDLPDFKLTSDMQQDRISPVDGKHRPHKGIDISMPEGTPLKSPGIGRVLRNNSAMSDSAGWYVEVEYNLQGERKVMRFLHLKERSSLEAGQRVEKGEVLGLSGGTGRSTGPHLHLEVRKGGDWGGKIGPAEDPFHYCPSHMKTQLLAKRDGKADPNWNHEMVA